MEGREDSITLSGLPLQKGSSVDHSPEKKKPHRGWVPTCIPQNNPHEPLTSLRSGVFKRKFLGKFYCLSARHLKEGRSTVSKSVS